jgi:competence protein ComEC
VRHSLFYPITVGFIFGIGLCPLCAISASMLTVFSIVSVAGVCFLAARGSIYEVAEISRYSIRFTILVFLASIFLGMIRCEAPLSYRGDVFMHRYANQTVTLTGVVCDEPSAGDSSVKIIIALKSFGTEAESRPIKNTKIVVFDQPYSKIKYGDLVTVTGVLEVPEPFADDGGRTFAYDMYLATDGIFYQMNHPKLDVIKENQGSLIKAFLFSIKEGFIGKISKVISFPESTLAAGLTVAGKQALPKDIQQEFLRSGTLQVVVLSGFNVTLVAEALMAVFSFLPLAAGAWAGILGIILFTILTGASATVVRGSVMAVCVIAARLARRSYDVQRALVVSAFLMLLYNPLLIDYDPSFQYSFLATLGLILFSPMILSYIGWIPERMNIRGAVAATIAAELFVLPLLVYMTGQLSVVALPANIALFSVIPLTMLLVFAAGSLALIHPFLAYIASWPAQALLFYMLAAVHFFSSLSWAFISTPSISFWLVIAIYAGYAVVIIWYTTKNTATNNPP